MEGMRNASKMLVRKPEGKRPLGRHRRRWEDISLVVRDIVWEGVDLIRLAEDKDQWRSCIHGNESSDSKEGGKFFD
jgi:hypothetical protein